MNFPRGLAWPQSFYAMLVLVVGIGAVAYGSVAMIYGRDASLYLLLDALLGASLVLVALAWGTEPGPVPVSTPVSTAVPPPVPAEAKASPTANPKTVPARGPGAPVTGSPTPPPVWAEDWSSASSRDAGPSESNAEVIFSEIDRLSVELSRRRKTP